MAKIAPDPLSTRFYGFAGITAESISGFRSEMEQSHRRYLALLEERSGETAKIPIVNSMAALTSTNAPGENDIEDWIVVDTEYVPASARAIRMREWKPWVSYPGLGDVLIVDLAHPIHADNIGEAPGRGQLFAMSVGFSNEHLEVPQVSELAGSGFDRVDQIPPGFYVGPLERYETQWGRVQLEEIRIPAGRSPYVVAYSVTPLPEHREQIDAVGASAADVQAMGSTGGRFVLQPAVRFIFPIVQLVHAAREMKK